MGFQARVCLTPKLMLFNKSLSMFWTHLILDILYLDFGRLWREQGLGEGHGGKRLGLDLILALAVHASGS